MKAPIVPGIAGEVVIEDVETFSLDLPRELFDYCAARGVTPSDVLHAFIGDLCALHNPREYPREDGYSSNGHLARWFAREYFRVVFSWLADTDRPRT